MRDKAKIEAHQGLVRKWFWSQGLAEPDPEHRFHPQRKWRFDWAWVEERVALEVEGGIWIRGRHNHPAGFVKDMEKYNAAASLGWSVLRVQPKELLTVETARMVMETIQARNQV